MNNSRSDSAAGVCVNLAPGCIDDINSSLSAVSSTLTLPASLSVLVFHATV